MQVTLDTTAIAAAIGALAGVLTTASVAWTRVVRPIQRIAEDWKGEPARPDDGLPARPGVMLRLAVMETRQTQIWNELHPNGGASMKDQLTRVDANLSAHVATHSAGVPVVLTAPPPFGAMDGTHGTASEGRAA